MTIDKIIFEQLYPTGIYANQRYRIEASVSEGEDLVECYKVLQRKTEEAFTALNPQIKWEEEKNPSIIDKQKEKELRKIESSIEKEEENVKRLEEELAKTDFAQQDAYLALNEEYEASKKRLSALMRGWENFI